MNAWSWIMIIATIAVLAYNIPMSWREDRELERDAAETAGTLVRYERAGRSSHVSVFKYEVNSTTYTVGSVGQLFNDCVSTKWCIGERYVIRYWRPQPARAKVMWDKPLPRSDGSEHRVLKP